MPAPVRHFTDIPLNDPDLFMEAAIIRGRVAGIPTILLQGDSVVFETAAVRAALDQETQRQSSRLMMARMAGAAQAATAQGDVAALRFAQKALDDDLIALLQKKTQRSGVVPPVNLPDYDGTQATPVGLSLMPGRNISSERYIAIHPAFASKSFPDAAIPGKQLHFFFSTHELAHVAGADEPQADKIAALFNRRAFGNDAAACFISDLRALDAVTDCFQLIQMTDESATPLVMERYMKYGWDMVAAADEALAVQVHQLDDAAILAHATMPRDTMGANKAFFHMAERMLQSGHGPSSAIAAFADTAARFAQAARTATPDTATHAMAGRLALAARRLATGRAAYGGNPCP